MLKRTAFLLTNLLLIVRVSFSAPGALDPTFGGDGVIVYNGPASWYDRGNGVAIQSDGKIVVTGYTFNGKNYDILLLRYNSDGTLDWTFGTNGVVTFNGPGNGHDYGNGVTIQPDGKIVVTGLTSTGPWSWDVDLLVLRYNTDGSLDTTFGMDGVVTYDGDHFEDIGYDVAIQQDGKIVITGCSINISGGHDYEILILRFNNDGTLDNTFGSNGVVKYDYTNLDDCGYGITIQQDGKIVITGSTFHPNYESSLITLRLNTDGTLDSTFGDSGAVWFDDLGDEEGFDIAIQSDGKIVVAGYTSDNLKSELIVLRYNENGLLDNTFGEGGIAKYNSKMNGVIYNAVLYRTALTIQSNGKIVVTGYHFNGLNNDVLVLRYNNDGTLDPSFGEDGVFRYNGPTSNDDHGTALAIQNDGKIVITGVTYTGTPYPSDVLTLRLLGGDLPGATTLISPSKTISSITPTYIWNAVPDSTKYYLWVDDPISPKIQQWYTAAEAGCDTGTCSVTPNIALSPGAYQWKIQTWNPGGYGPWSFPMSFTIESISSITLQSPFNDATFNSCTLITTYQPTFSWSAIGTFTNYSILFSSSETDFSTKGILISKANIRGPSTSWTPAIGVWKKIMRLSYNDGIIRDIYWKVIGSMPDRSTVESEVRSFRIAKPQPVIINSPQSGILPSEVPPTFDFNLNGNVKFRLEFSPFSDFRDPKKVKTFNYTSSDPNTVTSLSQTLTLNQWIGVMKLVRGTGYFRIKAWDAINRATISETRFFNHSYKWTITITYQNNKAGWVSVDYTTTDPTSISLGGEAFISPTWWRCCSGSAEDTGVEVTWRNRTTGAEGIAYHTVKYGWFICPYCLYDHQWSASVPLDVTKDNLITITAADPAGNWGEALIKVKWFPF